MKETYKNYEIEVTAQQRADKWSPMVTFTPPVVGVHGFQIIGDFKTEAAAEVAGFDWARERIDKYSP
jgi:hypothetical protein